MRYRPTIATNDPHNLALFGRLQPGQWIAYGSARGRFMGVRNGTVWIAWAATARKRFADFAAAFHGRG